MLFSGSASNHVPDELLAEMEAIEERWMTDECVIYEPDTYVYNETTLENVYVEGARVWPLEPGSTVKCNVSRRDRPNMIPKDVGEDLVGIREYMVQLPDSAPAVPPSSVVLFVVSRDPELQGKRMTVMDAATGTVNPARKLIVQDNIG